MTIRHLTVFMKVCEKMNMTAAARELFISQPAVSQTISELESYYCVPLFHRQSGKLHLTGAGEKLRKLTTQLLFWNEEIEKTMKNTRTLPPIKIGGPFSASDNLLSRIVAAYDREVGRARILLDDCTSEDLVQKLLSAEVDLACLDGDTYSKDIAEFPFLNDELIFLCRRDDPLLEGAEEDEGICLVEREAVVGRRWLLHVGGSGSARVFEEIMHKNHLDYEVRGRFTSDTGVHASAACGLGLGVIAESGLSRSIDDSLVPFRIRGISFPLTLKVAYHREKHLFPEFREFLDFVLGYDTGR